MKGLNIWLPNLALVMLIAALCLQAAGCKPEGPASSNVQMNEKMAYYHISNLAVSCELFKFDKGRYPIALKEMVRPTLTPREERHGAVDPPWAQNQRDITGLDEGYTYQYAPGKIGKKPAFYIVAVPKQYGVTGIESFYVDQTGSVGFTCEDRPATDNDPFFLKHISSFCQ